MSDYPNAIDPLEACENDAVHAIQTTLGTIPQGIYANVGTRLSVLEDRPRMWYLGQHATPQDTIDAAYAEGGGTVVVPWGVTELEYNSEAERFLTLRPGVSLVGYGPQSILKVKDASGNFKYILSHDPAEDLSGISLADFAIDYNHTGNPLSYTNDTEWQADTGKARFAIHLFRGKNISISNLHFRNILARNVVKTGSLNEFVTISGCHFACALPAFDYDHSSIYLNGHHHKVLYNTFAGQGWGARTAIELHHAGHVIIGNIETGYDHHGIIVVADKCIIAHNMLTKPINTGWGEVLHTLVMTDNVVLAS